MGQAATEITPFAIEYLIKFIGWLAGIILSLIGALFVFWKMNDSHRGKVIEKLTEELDSLKDEVTRLKAIEEFRK